MAEQGSSSSNQVVPNAVLRSHPQQQVGGHFFSWQFVRAPTMGFSGSRTPAKRVPSSYRPASASTPIRNLVYKLCPELRKSMKILTRCLRDPIHKEITRELFRLVKEYKASQKMLTELIPHDNALLRRELKKNIPEERRRLERYVQAYTREEQKQFPKKIEEVLKQLLEAERQEQLRKELEELRINNLQ